MILKLAVAAHPVRPHVALRQGQAGQRVSQGTVIGYVGSTDGLARTCITNPPQWRAHEPVKMTLPPPNRWPEAPGRLQERDQARARQDSRGRGRGFQLDDGSRVASTVKTAAARKAEPRGAMRYSIACPIQPARLFLGLIYGQRRRHRCALVRFDDDTAHARPELVFGRTYAWETMLRARLVALASNPSPDPGTRSANSMCASVARSQTRRMRRSRTAAWNAAQLAAIGSNGQTLRHRGAWRMPFTADHGDRPASPSVRGRSGGDFRRRDVAPVATARRWYRLPCGHAARRRRGARRAQLGGIANLPCAAQGTLRGFDTGPRMD